MIRAVRAIRNLCPIGIDFTFTYVLQYRFEKTYDFDDIALVHAIDSMLRSGELVQLSIGHFARVDMVQLRVSRDTMITLNATETIA